MEISDDSESASDSDDAEQMATPVLGKVAKTRVGHYTYFVNRANGLNVCRFDNDSCYDSVKRRDHAEAHNNITSHLLERLKTYHAKDLEVCVTLLADPISV